MLTAGSSVTQSGALTEVTRDVLRAAAASGSREDGGLHRSVSSPSPSRCRCRLFGRPRGAAGAQCGGPRGTRRGREGGGEVGPLVRAHGDGKPARPLPTAPCGSPDSAGRLRLCRLCRAGGGMCRGGSAWRVSLHVREASWMALGGLGWDPTRHVREDRTNREDGRCLE